MNVVAAGTLLETMEADGGRGFGWVVGGVALLLTSCCSDSKLASHTVNLQPTHTTTADQATHGCSTIPHICSVSLCSISLCSPAPHTAAGDEHRCQRWLLLPRCTQSQCNSRQHLKWNAICTQLR